MINPTTPAVDVKVFSEIKDVYVQAPTVEDYQGKLKIKVTIRFTDHNNGSSGSEAATVVDIEFPFPINCTMTTDITIGSTCSITTSFNAVLPTPLLVNGKRMVMEVGWSGTSILGDLLAPLKIFDAGPDGDIDTDSDNTPFMVPGVFVP